MERFRKHLSSTASLVDVQFGVASLEKLITSYCIHVYKRKNGSSMDKSATYGICHDNPPGIFCRQLGKNPLTYPVNRFVCHEISIRRLYVALPSWSTSINIKTLKQQLMIHHFRHFRSVSSNSWVPSNWFAQWIYPTKTFWFRLFFHTCSGGFTAFHHVVVS